MFSIYFKCNFLFLKVLFFNTSGISVTIVRHKTTKLTLSWQENLVTLIGRETEKNPPSFEFPIILFLVYAYLDIN